MADDAATRVRRSRLHRTGDHSICLPRNCPDAEQRFQAEHVAELTEPVPQYGSIEEAVQAYVDSLPFVDGDPRKLLAQVAVMLGKRVDETEAVPAAVRELRVLLLQLTDSPNGPHGQVDELRLRKAQRRLDVILGRVS